MAAIKQGVLYVVATPIGNLEDITYRAVRVLKDADLIACEDTRQTRKLLDHYGIEKPMVSYHEHNEMVRARELAGKLVEGAIVAQESDAGMVAALAASGLPTDAFEFRGFLPAKAGQRRTALEQMRRLERTAVFYEAPHRIRETMEDIVQILGGQRPVVIARELTKLHEEFIRGTAMEVLENARSRELKGEITLLIGKAETGAPAAASGRDLRSQLEQVMREQKLDEKSALKFLARELGVSKSEIYRELQRQKSKT